MEDEIVDEKGSISMQKANRFLRNRTATLVLLQDTLTTSTIEVTAINVRIGRDTTRWTNAQEHIVRGVPTTMVYAVKFRRRNAWVEGLFVGLAASIPAAITAASLYWNANQPKNTSDEQGVLGLTAGIGSNLAGVTAAVGTVLVSMFVGLNVKGGIVEYRINRDLPTR